MNLIRPKNKFDIVGIRVIHFMHFSAFDILKQNEHGITFFHHLELSPPILQCCNNTNLKNHSDSLGEKFRTDRLNCN